MLSVLPHRGEHHGATTRCPRGVDNRLCLLCDPEDLKRAMAELNIDGKVGNGEEKIQFVPNYVDIIKEIKHDKITVTEYQEHVDSEPFQEMYSTIEEVYDDLFTTDPSWALAHCVSEDLAMFRGIALEFRRRFKQINFLKQQRATIGHVAALYHVSKHEVEERRERFVFYMVTKQLFHHKPTYYHIYCALMRVRKICQELHVTKIAFPRIASGCDRMDFRKVKHLIYMVFADTPILVRVYTKK